MMMVMMMMTMAMMTMIMIIMMIMIRWDAIGCTSGWGTLG